MAKIINATGVSISVSLGGGRWQAVSPVNPTGETITNIASVNTIRDGQGGVHNLVTPVAGINPGEEYTIELTAATYVLWRDGVRVSNYN
ncbi:hypothetical protein AAA294_15370 [Fusobacterium varium]|uniref:hypothetical protein n=1 Tax=Fusobacterium varium TaxID=856 RepID=UPI0032C0AF8A